MMGIFLSWLLILSTLQPAEAAFIHKSRERLWPQPTQIPVCWLESTRGHSDLKQMIRTLIQKQYGRAGLTFVGWQPCLENEVSIRFGFESQLNLSFRGHSMIGRPPELSDESYTSINIFQMLRFEPQTKRENEVLQDLNTQFLNCRIEGDISACEDLNPMLNERFSYRVNNRILRSKLSHYVHHLSVALSTALHEVGHALGMEHEHSRSIAQNEKTIRCSGVSGSQQKPNKDGMLYEFPEDTEDKKSIMHNCVKATQLTLSSWDVEGLARVYFRH